MEKLSLLKDAQVETASILIASRYAPEPGREDINDLIAAHLQKNPADADCVRDNFSEILIRVNRKISLAMSERNSQETSAQSNPHASGPGFFAEDEWDD